MTVDMQHHLDRVFAAFGEEFFQNMNDELHRRVIVVEQEDLVEGWFFGLRARTGDDTGAGIVALAISAVRIAHLVPQSFRGDNHPPLPDMLSQKLFWVK